MNEEELVERIAIELFDIWKEAKSSTEDSWDDISFMGLTAKHKEEYYKTARRLIRMVREQP